MQDLQILKLLLEQSSMVLPHGVMVFNTGCCQSADIKFAGLLCAN